MQNRILIRGSAAKRPTGWQGWFGGAMGRVSDLQSTGSTSSRGMAAQQLWASCLHPCAPFTKQYTWHQSTGGDAVAGKITVGLALHWSWVTDFSVLATYGRWCRCQVDPNGSPTRELEETTRAEPYHMAEHHPVRSESLQPHTEWSSRPGSEPSSVEADVYL